MQMADDVGMVWASIRKEDERLNMPGRMLGDIIGPGRSAYTDDDEAVVDRTIGRLNEWKVSGDIFSGPSKIAEDLDVYPITIDEREDRP